MQQSVLVTAMRGPDGIAKDHVSKLLIRWLRRCVLYSAFESAEAGRPLAFADPLKHGGGSFTGPSATWRPGITWRAAMREVTDDYFRHVDELPHHFQLHFMHAVEIIGYKHPDPAIRQWWLLFYHRLANDLHLLPEPEERMDRRLGDRESDWRRAEEVVSQGPEVPVA
jgi:hypothetical protein